MNNYESYLQELMDPSSRRKRIERLKKTIKWSFVATVLCAIAAFASYFGQRPSFSGIMMGLSAMNLAIGASNTNFLILALYVDKIEEKRNSEPTTAADAVGGAPE